MLEPERIPETEVRKPRRGAAAAPTPQNQAAGAPGSRPAEMAAARIQNPGRPTSAPVDRHRTVRRAAAAAHRTLAVQIAAAARTRLPNGKDAGEHRPRA